MIFDPGLIFAGILISTIAIAVGIGGGILWTPLLILVYDMAPQDAIATSLLIQIVGMGSGTLAYFRSGKVETKLSLIFVLVALPGVIIGSYVTVTMAQETVQMALGIMSMMLAILFVSANVDINMDEQFKYTRKDIAGVLPIPAFFGFILGSLSLGISEWLIPALRSRLKLDMTTAIATAIPMMFILAIVASFIHWIMVDNFNYNYFLWGAIGTFIGGQLGAHISSHINERILKQSFIYLMTLIGIHLIFQSI